REQSDLQARLQECLGEEPSYRLPSHSAGRLVHHVLHRLSGRELCANRRGPLEGRHHRLATPSSQPHHSAWQGPMGPRRCLQTICDLRWQAMDALVQRSQGWRRADRAGAASGGGLGLLRQATAAAVTGGKAIMQLMIIKIEKPDDTNFILARR